MTSGEIILLSIVMFICIVLTLAVIIVIYFTTSRLKKEIKQTVKEQFLEENKAVVEKFTSYLDLLDEQLDEKNRKIEQLLKKNKLVKIGKH